jgi:hypothetical protein
MLPQRSRLSDVRETDENSWILGNGFCAAEARRHWRSVQCPALAQAHLSNSIRVIVSNPAGTGQDAELQQLVRQDASADY